MGLLRLFKRWRCGKGYGVHSPFAYRMITCVLRGRGEYYASSRLYAMPDGGLLRLLFRLVCDFEPVRVYGLRSEERVAVSLADSRIDMRQIGDPDGVIVMHSAKGVVSVVRDVIASPDLWSRVKDGLEHGMTFSNGRVGVAVTREDLPRQDFEISF